jgi:flagellar motility protein MotE (MotC chaperone)
MPPLAAAMPMAIPQPARISRPVRALWLIIWLLVTLLLFGTAVSAWVYHHTQVRMQDAETRWQQAVTQAQQQQAEQQRQLTAAADAANERENQLVGELATLRTGLEQVGRDLEQARHLAVELKTDLDVRSGELTRAQTDLKDLSRDLVESRAALAALRAQASLVEIVRTASGRLVEGFRAANATTGRAQPVHAEAPAGADDALPDSRGEQPEDTTPRVRQVPHVTTLGQDDAAAQLRPILPRQPAANEQQ